jgi:hypothetical protein
MLKRLTGGRNPKSGEPGKDENENEGEGKGKTERAPLWLALAA